MVNPEEIVQTRELLNEIIGRTKYSDVAKWIDTSPASFSDRLKRGTLRVTDLLIIAERMNKQIVVEKKI